MLSTIKFSYCIVILGTLWVALLNAQMLEHGACKKNVPTVENFDVSKYMGRWYEQEKYPFIYEFAGKCIHYTYNLLKNGEVEMAAYQLSVINNISVTVTGVGKVVGSGKLIVQFEGIPSYVEDANYLILDTDYSNYSVVYYCSEFVGLFNIKHIWLLTRERHPSMDLIMKVRRIIAGRGYDVSILQKTNQTGCEND